MQKLEEQHHETASSMAQDCEMHLYILLEFLTWEMLHVL